MATVPALRLMVPASVSATGSGSSASVSATGKVTFTVAETVVINQCFTRVYDDYLIVMRHKGSTAGSDMNIRLRVGGVDASGSNYTYQYIYATAASITGARATVTYAPVGTCGSSQAGTHVYLYGPNIAQPTAIRGVAASDVNGAELLDYVTTHSVSTAYDSFTLLQVTAGRTMTGSLCVYGFTQ